MATLTDLRKAKGYRRIENFAIAADVSPSTVRRAEKGEDIGSLTASRLAKALGISLTEFEKLEGISIKDRGM